MDYIIHASYITFWRNPHLKDFVKKQESPIVASRMLREDRIAQKIKEDFYNAWGKDEEYAP